MLSTMLSFVRNARTVAGHRPGHGPCPGGTSDSSPTFQRWDCDADKLSPEATAENHPPFQPSLRDLVSPKTKPNVETLGFFRMSLRDKTQPHRRYLRSKLTMSNRNRSGVGQTSGLPVHGASGSVNRVRWEHRARGPANRQTRGLPHHPT